MQRRNLALAFVLLIGSCLVGYGAATGDEGWVGIEAEAIEAAELPEDAAVVQYDFLEPSVQDAFRNAIRTDDEVRVDSVPAADERFVQYRDSYYQWYVISADAGQTTMFFSIAGGLVIIVVGTLGWLLARRRTR